MEVYGFACWGVYSGIKKIVHCDINAMYNLLVKPIKLIKI